MDFTIINSMKTTMESLRADLDISQDIIKDLQNDQANAKKVIAEITKKIADLTAIQSYDAVNIPLEIESLTTLKATAEGKLNLIEAALTTALAEHNTAYKEYEKIKAGIETLTDLLNNDFESKVAGIQAPSI